MSSNITKCKNYFMLDFWDEIKKEKTYSNTYIDEDKAKEKANELDIEFYYKHKYILPKGISINYGNKIFNIIIPTQHIRGEKNIKLGSAKTLREIKTIKEELIKCLI